MKIVFFIFFNILIFQINTQAQVFNVPFFTGLSCAGESKLNSTQRRDLINGGASIPARFSSLDEEFNFHKNRVQQRSGHTALLMAEAYKDWKDSFAMKAGIHFDPVNLGLPANDNGCKVVPVIIKSSQTAISYESKTIYVVSEDDWNRLSGIDQLLAILSLRMDRSMSLPKVDYLKSVAFLLSDDTFAITLKDYFLHSTELGLPGISYDGSDFRTCYFSNANIPMECLSSTFPFSHSVLLNNRLSREKKVTYGPTGKIVSAWLYYAKLVPKNLREPEKLIPCSFEHLEDTFVLYSGNGELRYCANTFNEPAQGLVVKSGKGYQINSGKVLFTTFSLKYLVEHESEAKQEFPNLPGFAPTDGGNCGKTVGGKVVELFPNGNFKSGIMRSTKTWIDEFYFEMDAKGNILKKIPRTCDNIANWYTPYGIDFVNSDSVSKIYKFSATNADHYISEIRPLYQSRPNCIEGQKDKKGRVTKVIVQPDCFTYARVLEIGG